MPARVNAGSAPTYVRGNVSLHKHWLSTYSKTLPDPPFALRRMTEGTGRSSYKIRQKLDALRYSRQRCADGGLVGKRGAAKVLNIDAKLLRDLEKQERTFDKFVEQQKKGGIAYIITT